VTFRTA